MKLIVGLGNPGKEYQGTRHNLGFMVVEELARRHGVRRQEFMNDAVVAWLDHKGGEMVIAKPLTYMNRSGLAVKPLLAKWQLNLEDLIVVCDDLDLERGRIRLRARGSSGGHRGLDSIIKALGTQDFARLRVGIGRPDSGADVVNYVLERFSEEEKDTISEAITRAADAIECWVTQGIEKAMSSYNFSERS